MNGNENENIKSETQKKIPASDLRIVFMGTPEFAVASLHALVQAGLQVVGVITAPDKPAGRGLQLQQSAVKKYAVEKGLTILQPPKLKDPQFLNELKALQPDLQVVVAFRMLPQVVWALPPLGTINVHGSLLPQYRGAAPINWAVINGERETGVTTFKLQQEIDTGAILLQEKISIGDDETAGSLHDRMKKTGAQLLVKTIVDLTAGTLIEMPQQAGGSGLKHAPKLTTETSVIDWTKPVAAVYNLIRGLAPYPAAFTELDGKKVKLYAVSKEDNQPTEAQGTLVTDKKTFLKFACADGYINILELQLEGKKRMAIADFLRGYRFSS
ncbi:MAG TPA: methionyl-tRNA formyltransferase [Chitinophagaceae bacterium]|nr:methionyl-tRNA formyltransferase [Chitinophagaceae bacterium]